MVRSTLGGTAFQADATIAWGGFVCLFLSVHREPLGIFANEYVCELRDERVYNDGSFVAEKKTCTRLWTKPFRLRTQPERRESESGSGRGGPAVPSAAPVPLGVGP